MAGRGELYNYSTRLSSRFCSHQSAGFWLGCIIPPFPFFLVLSLLRLLQWYCLPLTESVGKVWNGGWRAVGYDGISTQARSRKGRRPWGYPEHNTVLILSPCRVGGDRRESGQRPSVSTFTTFDLRMLLGSHQLWTLLPSYFTGKSRTNIINFPNHKKLRENNINFSVRRAASIVWHLRTSLSTNFTGRETNQRWICWKWLCSVWQHSYHP